MQTRHLFIALLLLPLFACDKDDVNCGLPECIENIIDTYEPICAEGGTIEEYIFQNRHVFLFNNEACCCDQQSMVVSNECDTLGFLGGIIGNYMINGESFETAILQDTIWP